MFPTEIFKEEEELGYEICDITNPEQYGFSPSPTVKAVIYRLGESDWIIKVNAPNGSIVYVHQRYGLYEWQVKKGGKPDWKPVNTYFEPKTAIEKALTGFENVLPNRIKIIPKVPGK